MAKLLSTILFSFMLLTSGAYAMSMGSLVRNGVDSISSNESAMFTIIFWNAGSDTYEVVLNPRSVPEGWAAVIEPKDFYLNSSSGNEYISLPYIGEPVKATVVKVIIKPTFSAPTGKYNVTVTAVSKYPGSDIGFSQERVFNLVVDFSNHVVFENHSQKTSATIVSGSANEFQNITSIAVGERGGEDASYLYLAVTLVIVLFSFIVYKYS
jgi:uncharacterized membrane protein